MFTSEEINNFKKEVETILKSRVKEEGLVSTLLTKFNFEIGLNHDAKLLRSNIDKFLIDSSIIKDDYLLNAIVKGLTIYNYRTEIGKFLATL